MVKRWTYLLWIGLLIWNFHLMNVPSSATQKERIEKEITQKKKDLKEIKKEISETREKERQIRGQETSILGTLQRIETELYQKEKEVKQMEDQLRQTKGRILQTQEQIYRLSAEIERTQEELFSRLRAIYRMGRIPPQLFLLNAQSYLDLLKMDRYLRVIVETDSQLLEAYRSQLALKENYQKHLEEDRKQLEHHLSEVEKRREEIREIREEKKTLLKSIQNQKVVYQKLIVELEERARALQSLIQRLEQEKSVMAYGKSKPLTFKGKLDPPVYGKVISLFKERGQNGIEIQAPIGSEVRAILPGKVLFADWFKGFGNLMIIDHGEGTFTVSGYLSQLMKKPGEMVEKGEVIALVGSGGSLKGPCLYFEVRHRGKPQDPMDWISSSEKIVSLPEGGEGKKD